MTQTVSALTWLQDWYFARCDGEWEHGFGVNIATIDNPGWSVKINLVGTPWENLPDKEFIKNDDDLQWMHCFVRERQCQGACGPTDLDRMLEIFRGWLSEDALQGL